MGWQFYGDTKSSLETLKRYLKRNELGIGSVVTFTDFETGKEIIAPVPHFENSDEETVWQ